MFWLLAFVSAIVLYTVVVSHFEEQDMKSNKVLPGGLPLNDDPYFDSQLMQQHSAMIVSAQYRQLCLPLKLLVMPFLVRNIACLFGL